MELLVGASGYNGGNVARRLLEQGHTVRGLVRDAARAIPGLDEVVQGDVITGAGLKHALTGIDVAFYFVHALDAPDRRTDRRDLRAARQFVLAARAAVLPRGVFFTTLAAPHDVEPPVYQRNRLQVEQILLDGIPGMTAVRAGMVLGAQSRGLLPYVRLVQRFPVIPLGPWRTNHIAVIDPATATEAMIEAGTDDIPAGRSLDAPACAQPTHEQLVLAIIDALGKRRIVVHTPIATPRLDAAPSQQSPQRPTRSADTCPAATSTTTSSTPNAPDRSTTSHHHRCSKPYTTPSTASRKLPTPHDRWLPGRALERRPSPTHRLPPVHLPNVRPTSGYIHLWA